MMDFNGKWRITEMELWDQDSFDLVDEAFFAFEERHKGGFCFIAVEGWMDCRYGERDGLPLVEFTWEGHDECDPACGRGWAVIAEDGVLNGRIFFHQGDDSGFKAVRVQKPSANRRGAPPKRARSKRGER